METIRMYLENMFQALPKTSEVLNMKDELLGHMTDKYNELKAQGKSENEAVGIVISEFGNIDELKQEMGLNESASTVDTENIRVVERKEALDYIALKKNNGRRVGLGVMLILFGVSIMLFVSGSLEARFGEGMIAEGGGVIGVCILLICVAIAVALFIYSGSMEEKYDYLKKKFSIRTDLATELNGLMDSYRPTYTLSVVIGVTMIIIGVIPVLVTSIFEEMGIWGDTLSTLGVCFLISFVGVAVFIFIYFGSLKEAYSTLLQVGEYSSDHKEDDKLVSAVAAVVWPITVVVFLIWGFVYDGWGISWILFPIVGLLFGAFSGVVNILKHGTK